MLEARINRSVGNSDSGIAPSPEGIAVPQLLTMCAAGSNRSQPPRADAGRIFHVPPELLQLLKDTIPLLCASKMETILFFLGAGVPESWLADMKKEVETCRAGVTRASIAHDVLERLNRAK